MTKLDFKEAAEFFRRKAAEVEAAMTEMVDVAATIVEKEIKDELGTYQNAAGPFPAWAHLSEHTEEERAHMGFPSDNPLYVSGELQQSIHTESLGAHRRAVGTDKAYAPFLEHGTSKMPPRPFVGRGAYVKQEEVLEAQKAVLSAALRS